MAKRDIEHGAENCHRADDTLSDWRRTEALQRHPERARRYVELARKLGMRYNVRVPARQALLCKSASRSSFRP